MVAQIAVVCVHLAYLCGLCGLRGLCGECGAPFVSQSLNNFFVLGLYHCAEREISLIFDIDLNVDINVDIGIDINVGIGINVDIDLAIAIAIAIMILTDWRTYARIARPFCVADKIRGSPLTPPHGDRTPLQMCHTSVCMD